MTSPRLTELEDEAWQGFLYAHERVWRDIETAIAPSGVSMAEYSVLALLAPAGREGLRMSEIANRRLMSTGGTTRLADRLERRGLIERKRVEADARGYIAVLTPHGRRVLRDAWSRQHATLRHAFFDRLDDQDLRDLTRIWSRVVSERDDTPRS